MSRTGAASASRALDEFIIRGVKTTIPLHKIIMKDPNFRAARGRVVAAGGMSRDQDMVDAAGAQDGDAIAQGFRGLVSGVR